MKQFILLIQIHSNSLRAKNQTDKRQELRSGLRQTWAYVKNTFRVLSNINLLSVWFLGSMQTWNMSPTNVCMFLYTFHVLTWSSLCWFLIVMEFGSWFCFVFLSNPSKSMKIGEICEYLSRLFESPGPLNFLFPVAMVRFWCPKLWFSLCLVWFVLPSSIGRGRVRCVLFTQIEDLEVFCL